MLAMFVATPALTADTQSTDLGGNESLGGRLLDDLAPLPTNKNDQAAPAPVAPPKGAPAQRDVSQPPVSAMVPLARVQQGMQNAQALLAQPGSDKRTGTIKLAGTVQQDVVSELDKLIAELSKQCQCQCQGGQCDKPGESGKPKPGNKPGTAAGNGKSPARESSDRLDRTTARAVDKGDVNEVLKELWGHLPERERQQMLQSFSDEFLPKYELEIEQYYRKLSEERAKGEARPAK
jgi:hypothetical protein